MDDPEVHKASHLSWGSALFRLKQELILFKKALSQHYRNRLVSDWHYFNQLHYCYSKKIYLYRYVGYGYRHVEYGSSRAWSAATEMANFLTALELFSYLSILLFTNNTRCRTRDDIKLSNLNLLKVWKGAMVKLINWGQLIEGIWKKKKWTKRNRMTGRSQIFFCFVKKIHSELHIWH